MVKPSHAMLHVGAFRSDRKTGESAAGVGGDGGAGVGGGLAGREAVWWRQGVQLYWAQ